MASHLKEIEQGNAYHARAPESEEDQVPPIPSSRPPLPTSRLIDPLPTHHTHRRRPSTTIPPTSRFRFGKQRTLSLRRPLLSPDPAIGGSGASDQSGPQAPSCCCMSQRFSSHVLRASPPVTAVRPSDLQHCRLGCIAWVVGKKASWYSRAPWPVRSVRGVVYVQIHP
jgi:hypothetical protein